MAKDAGWWHIVYTVEPSDFDREHIAQLIRQGYTEGEIVQSKEDEED